MRKFKTDEIGIGIDLKRSDDEENQIINIYYVNKDGDTLEENKVTLPSSICKQSFNDANLTQNIINFFIKE